MAGKIKVMIEQLIQVRTKGNPHMVAPLKIKLIIKGIDPDLYNEMSEDNPIVMQRLQSLAKTMGCEL